MIHTCKPSTLNQEYVRERKGLLFQVLLLYLLCLDSAALLTPRTSCPSLCRAEIWLRLKTLLPKFLVCTHLIFPAYMVLISVLFLSYAPLSLLLAIWRFPCVSRFCSSVWSEPSESRISLLHFCICLLYNWHCGWCISGRVIVNHFCQDDLHCASSWAERWFLITEWGSVSYLNIKCSLASSS